MTSIIPNSERVIKTPEVIVWIEYLDGQRWYVEIFARRENGVQYFASECEERPSLDQLVRNAMKFGYFSPRPCSLDLQFDPSMKRGAFALLRHWCRVNSVDFESLMRDAYAGKPHPVADIDQVVAQAEWEGIDYPAPGDRYQTRRLLIALRDVGYHEIAEVLVGVIRQLP
jgi:hypothetical protein